MNISFDPRGTGPFYFVSASMTTQARHIQRHHASRPSIMEVYHMITEEEAQARLKEEQERDRYAKRWSSGYELLAEMQSRGAKQHSPPPPAIQLDDSLHESEIESPLQSKTRTSVSFSTSPPYSPPQAERPHREMSLYPLESSIYPSKHKIPQGSPLKPNASIPDVDHIVAESEVGSILTNDAVSMESKPEPDTQRSESEDATIPYDLWKMVQLLKLITHGSQLADRQNGDESIRQMMHLIKTQNASDSMFSQKDGDTTDALAMDLRLEKISLDDAEYAQRLDDIRHRLGELVTKIDLSSEHAASTDPSKASLVPSLWSQLCGSHISVIRTLFTSACIVVFALALLLGLRFRAEYLWQYSYHDILYPSLYPLPSYVSLFLSPDVEYGAPF